ncbi:MAG: GNAT family N-acetyltransferase [Chloroflexi bacterium]|nr:GNAT family N-acetyltransferase [Chloroflexota bacterium]
MERTVESAFEHSLEALCDLINESFVGYVGGEVHFIPRMLSGFLVQNGISLARSLVARVDGGPAGIALLARRGSSVRVGLMGVAQAAQNLGIGRWLIGEIEREARENGDHRLELEVIEQNPRAVHLYEATGFRHMRRLIGYSGEGLGGTPEPLQPVEIADAARRITAWMPPDTPWQCSGENLVTFGPPFAAYRMGYRAADAWAIVSNPAGEAITINGLAVPPEQQRQGVATRLVGALIAAHPGKSWRVPPICPEEYGPIFTRNGMTRVPINQFQMEKSFT